MPSLSIRWSEPEARKPYARPFGVSFLDEAGTVCGSVALSGQDLLYLQQFRAAVLALGGELFDDPSLRAAADPQHQWLDRIAALLPAVREVSITPGSSFDHAAGRVFGFAVRDADGAELARVEAHQLLEYQEFQAAVAHQSGRLYRDPEVEATPDHISRQAAWLATLRTVLARPDASEAMTETWPWR